MINEFDAYRIYYYSAPGYKYKVMVDLYKGNAFAGRALFMKSGEQIPVNIVENGFPLLHQSIDDFQNVLLILALDKPLYINVTSNGIGAISTSTEAIGDLDK